MAKSITTRHPITCRALQALVCLLVLASGCTSPGKPVPPGDRAALEQLADAYRAIAEGLPSNPVNLSVEDRRRFIDTVFREAGYDYSATVSALGKGGLDPNEALHRDLAQLVLLPTTGLADEEIEKIYSAQELTAVARIQDAMR